jgi:hypothetical protein
MKVDGLDWMDWLHRTRREMEEERKRLGLSGEEWLKQVEERARAIREEISALRPAVARDRKPGS